MESIHQLRIELNELPIGKFSRPWQLDGYVFDDLAAKIQHDETISERNGFADIVRDKDNSALRFLPDAQQLQVLVVREDPRGITCSRPQWRTATTSGSSPCARRPSTTSPYIWMKRR